MHFTQILSKKYFFLIWPCAHKIHKMGKSFATFEINDWNPGKYYEDNQLCLCVAKEFGFWKNILYLGTSKRRLVKRLIWCEKHFCCIVKEQTILLISSLKNKYYLSKKCCSLRPDT